MHQPTNTIHLRVVQDDDLPIFFEHQSDEQASTMAGVPSRPYEVFMAHWRHILHEPEIVIRTITVDSAVAGHIVSFMQHDEREVGYWIGRMFWGQGIATTALRLFIQDVEHRPLAAFVVTSNHASMRVLEKCGFTMVDETDEGYSFRRPAPAEESVSETDT